MAGNCDYGALEPLDGLAAFDQVVVFYTHGHMYGVKYDLDTLATMPPPPAGLRWRCSATPTFPRAEQRGKVFLFNPGSCGRCYTGPNTYGVLTLDNGKVDHLRTRRGTQAMSINEVRYLPNAAAPTRM